MNVTSFDDRFVQIGLDIDAPVIPAANIDLNQDGEWSAYFELSAFVDAENLPAAYATHYTFAYSRAGQHWVVEVFQEGLPSTEYTMSDDELEDFATNFSSTYGEFTANFDDTYRLASR